MKISLCMIVKNEEKYIKMCIDNVMGLVDEIIIVDTGSTDKTTEILKEYGDKINLYHYEWDNNFSNARNISLEKATGEWILVLDADEKLVCDSEALKKQLEDTDFEGFMIPLYNIINTKVIVYSAVYCKLFRNNGHKYIGAIHEQIDIDDKLKELREIDTKLCKIFHYGYMEDTMKDKAKAKRNLEILKKQLKENPVEPYIYYNIGVSLVIEGNYEKALENFFKCNELAGERSLTQITKYEIDMVKRMAECFYKLGKFKDAIEFIDGLIKDPTFQGFVDLIFIKAHCYYALKQHNEAVMNWNKCIEMGETKKFISVYGMGSYMPKLMLARLYAEIGNEGKAITQYMEAIFDTNNYLKDGLNEVRFYLSKNHREEILQHLNKLIDGENK